MFATQVSSIPRRIHLSWFLMLLVAPVLTADAALVVELDVTAHAYGGPGADPLPGDLGPRWQGSESYAGVFGGTADLDWAVFQNGAANGDFQDFLDENNIAATDPTQPGEFVYAYHVNNLTGTGASLASVSVGKDGDEIISIAPTSVAPAFYTGPSISHPTVGTDIGSSAVWDFESVTSGETTILYFASPNIPELDNASILLAETIDRVGSPSGFLEPNTIVPEPGSILIAICGAALVGCLRRR